MENKTIKQYMDEGHLKIGGFLYSYGLGYLHKYEFMKIVASEYNDEEYALLKAIEVMDYESKKWHKVLGYDYEHTWCRANIRFDTRFNISPIECLKEGIKSLEKHIESSTWQKKKAEKILSNIKS